MFYFSLLHNVDIIPSNVILSISVFRTFGTSLGLRHLAELAYSEFITLFAKQSSVFFCNRYNVSSTNEE